MRPTRRSAVILTFTVIAILATPAILLSQLRTSTPRPAGPAAPPPTQPVTQEEGVVITDDGGGDEGGGGGNVVTSQSVSVDWEIVEWGVTGHDDFTATYVNGQLDQIEVRPSQGEARSISRVQMEALGIAIPTATTFSKPSMAPASVQSASFSQTINSIYGNSLTVRGTVHF